MPPEVESSRSPACGGEPTGALTTAVSGPSGLLQALQHDTDDLRAVIQCTICMKPLYEPFTLGCGHTFCYSCLTQWFITHRYKETCPECRAPVKSEPAPAYLVRNIVNLFIGRAELLENDETTTEHLNNQRAETEKMEKDKANTDPTTGGLFQGCFRRSRLDAVPFHDASDGVDRCPDCAWELEDGECVNCGFAIDMLSSSSFNSELGRSGLPDIPPEMATEMAIDELVNAGGDPENTPTWGEFWPAWLPAPVVRRNISQGQANGFGSLDRDEFSPDRSSRSSADEDEDSDEMNSFIDDDMDRGESEGSEQPTVVGGFVARDSSSFAQSGEDGHAATSLVDDRAVSVSSDDGTDKDDRDADDDDDDEQPIRAPGRLSRFRDRATLQPYPPPSPSYAGHSPHSPRVHRGSTVGEVISVDEDSESPHAPSRPRRGDDTRRFRR